jgi:hypothetical protein
MICNILINMKTTSVYYTKQINTKLSLFIFRKKQKKNQLRIYAHILFFRGW